MNLRDIDEHGGLNQRPLRASKIIKTKLENTQLAQAKLHIRHLHSYASSESTKPRQHPKLGYLRGTPNSLYNGSLPPY